jgi:hypothetical protein
MMKRVWLRPMLGVLFALGMTACAKGAEPGATTSGNVTTPGIGGATGGGGAGGAAAPVVCGSMQCAPFMSPFPAMGGGPMGGFQPASPCCADPATSTCGWMMPGGACYPPPPADPECPGPFGMQGCCVVSADRCGLNLAVFGNPNCVDPSMFGMPGMGPMGMGPMGMGPMGMGPMGMGPGALQARRCDGTPIAPPPVGGAGGIAGAGGVGGSSAGSGGAGGATGGAGGARGGAGGAAAGGRGGAGGMSAAGGRGGSGGSGGRGP